MSRARHQINEFNIVYTMYPEFQQQVLDLTETLIKILDISDSSAQYLRELLHHLSITYDSIVITNRDPHQHVSLSTESDWKSWLYKYKKDSRPDSKRPNKTMTQPLENHLKKVEQRPIWAELDTESMSST